MRSTNANRKDTCHLQRPMSTVLTKSAAHDPMRDAVGSLKVGRRWVSECGETRKAPQRPSEVSGVGP